MDIDINVERLLEENEMLRVKIQHIIDHMELPDKCYTFPDGDTWHQSPKKTLEMK
jgi:hypothetical protein